MINGGDSESFLIRICLPAIFYNSNNMTHTYQNRVNGFMRNSCSYIDLYCFRHLPAICTKFIQNGTNYLGIYRQ